jgi:hypothetical protein
VQLHHQRGRRASRRRRLRCPAGQTIIIQRCSCAPAFRIPLRAQTQTCCSSLCLVTTDLRCDHCPSIMKWRRRSFHRGVRGVHQSQSLLAVWGEHRWPRRCNSRNGSSRRLGSGRGSSRRAPQRDRAGRIRLALEGIGAPGLEDGRTFDLPLPVTFPPRRRRRL